MNKGSTYRTRISQLLLVISVGWLVYLGSCLHEKGNELPSEVEMVVDWQEFILDAEINTEGFRAPIAARTYGYVGLAAYETFCRIPGHSYQSLQKTLQFSLDGELEEVDQIHAGLALNSCYAAILRNFFASSRATILEKLEKQEKDWERKFQSGLEQEVVEHSIRLGQSIAARIYQWSSTDSLGHQANHHNYDRNFSLPDSAGVWVASVDFPMPPLLPYWGRIRPFLIETADFLAAAPPSFSTQPGHTYYQQALEIVSLTTNLTDENRNIAKFWSDDYPGLTYTAAGHWLAVTNLVVRKSAPDLGHTLETYLKLGFALSDAITACWHAKFHYMLLRPETFIQQYLNPRWRPVSPSPPFPAYPSGHAMFGAAAAEVLSDLYGDQFSLLDDSHDKHVELSIQARNFTSFYEMARENALSRILQGVHWRMDCEEGLRLGALIGQRINDLQLKPSISH